MTDMLATKQISLNNIMKHILFYLIALIIFISCSKKTNKDLNFNPFDEIDVSIFDGETSYYSLKIDNSGKTYISINKYGKSDVLFIINIGNDELDSISFLVNKITKIDIDTLYQGNCADCGSYRIIIKSNGGVIKTKVENINNSVEYLKNLNKLISYLMHIANDSKSEIDNVFIFESKTREFYPSVPPPQKTHY